jgi:hypothetical protein
MRRLVAILGAVALTLAIAVVAVAAGGPLRGLAASAKGGATPTAVGTADGGRGGMLSGGVAGIPTDLYQLAVAGAPGQDADRQAQCQTFVNNLATNLGVTNDALGAAVKKTLVQQIDAAQTAGKLTAAQAQTAKDHVNNANNADLCASIGGGGKGVVGGMAGGAGQGGMAFGMLQGDLLDAAAKYLGISSDVLKQELQDKGTLQAVAAAHSKDNDADKAGLLAALEQSLRTSLTGQGVAADRVEQAVTMLKQSFDRLYAAPLGRFGQGMPGGMPGRHGGPNQLPGQPGTRPNATPSAAPKVQ